MFMVFSLRQGSSRQRVKELNTLTAISAAAAITQTCMPTRQVRPEGGEPM
jgi:hypothetical protein